MESLVELYISSYSASWVYQSRGMVIAPAPSAEDRTLTIVEIISRCRHSLGKKKVNLAILPNMRSTPNLSSSMNTRSLKTVLGVGIDVLSMSRFEGLLKRRGAGNVAKKICSKAELALWAATEGEDASRQLRFLSSR